jgi:GNAT superfamily N-acetyltransferase
MIQIFPGRLPPGFSDMFSIRTPTGIRALAVLAGGNAGKIYTDDPLHPHWGLVWEADDGTLYRGGKITADVLKGAVELLRQEGLVAIGFGDGDPSTALFPPDPDAGAECLEFDRPIGSSNLSPYLNKLPPRYSIQRMDPALWEHSPKRDDNLVRYGSMEIFFRHGIAVCILCGEETVCEAYADMDVCGTREIGIATQKLYRRQGLATIACAHLIQLCEAAGSSTYWDCVRLNAGSRALAHKLGFINERAYRLLAWFKPREPIFTDLRTGK